MKFRQLIDFPAITANPRLLAFTRLTASDADWQTTSIKVGDRTATAQLTIFNPPDPVLRAVHHDNAAKLLAFLKLSE